MMRAEGGHSSVLAVIPGRTQSREARAHSVSQYPEPLPIFLVLGAKPTPEHADTSLRPGAHRAAPAALCDQSQNVVQHLGMQTEFRGDGTVVPWKESRPRD